MPLNVFVTAHMTCPLRNGLGLTLLDLRKAGLFRSLALQTFDMVPGLLDREPGVVEGPVSVSLCRLGAHDSLTSRHDGRVLGIAVEKAAVMPIRRRGCVCGGRGRWVCRAMTPE